MADTVSSITPNLRFGTSFLNTKYRNRAANDEVLMDKTTGEIAYKRKSDGELIFYNREDIDLEKWLMFMQSQYEYNGNAHRPTKNNCTQFDSTYLLGTQYFVDDFSSTMKTDDGLDDKDFTHGGKLRNPFPGAFNISHEMNGIFLEVKANPRSVSKINLISSVYDRYFKTYSGTEESYIKEHEKFNINGFDGSTVEINYSITQYFKDGTSSMKTHSGYCSLNSPSYILFEDSSIKDREDIKYITFEFNYVGLPKLKFFDFLYTNVFSAKEKALYTKIKDDGVIEIKSIDMFTYSTTTDPTYSLPPIGINPICLLKASLVEEGITRVSLLSASGGIVCRVKSPSDEEWRHISMWAEKVRAVYEKGETEDLGADTSVSDLENLFGKLEQIETRFVFDINENGFYLQKISGKKELSLPW